MFHRVQKNTRDREEGRAQLWSQIASLELGQHRQRLECPCVLVVSLLSVSFFALCVYIDIYKVTL